MKYIITLLAVVSGSTLFAQRKELAGVSYSYDKADYNAQQVNAFVRFPMMANGGGSLMYRHLKVDQYTFESFSAQLFYKFDFSDKKSLALIGSAGIYSEEWRYGIGFRYQYKHSDKVKTGIGMMYNRQFFGNQLIPFLDVLYEPNEQWTLSGLFPIRPKVLYHFNKVFSAGIEVLGETSSYARDSLYLRSNQWTGLIKVEWLLGKYLLLNAGIGRNFCNRYQVFEQDEKVSWTIITRPVGEKITPMYERDLKGWDATIGLSLRLSRD